MSQHQRVILHVTLNTGDQAPQPARVMEAETEELLGPLVAALLPASDGIPRQRPLPVPLEQYTVQAVARDTATPLFRVYAPPPAPIPAQGTELAALVSFGVAVRRGPEAAALWASLHALAGPAEVTLTDPTRPPRVPWCGVLCHSALFLHPAAAGWLGDFERCVAWTVIRGNTRQ